MTRQPHRLATLVVGGGPAGVALAIAARRMGMPAALRARGMMIIEREPALGAGEIGNYAIRSDSLADSFLKAVDTDASQALRPLLGRPAGRHLDSQRGQPVGLGMIGAFLGDTAAAVRESFRAEGEDPFATGLEALYSRREPDGSWLTCCKEASGRELYLTSNTLVLATGAHQQLGRLYVEKVWHLQLLPRYSAKLMQSAGFLAHDAQRKLAAQLGSGPIRRVVILGGSHSALAGAYKCLRGAGATALGCEQVTVVHRNALRLTYASVDAALRDGYTAFGPADVCRRTGRVYPLAGFRSDARDLLRHHWRLGGLESDPRLQLLRIGEERSAAVERLLDAADLIIAALGYRPRALPLFGPAGEPISLLCETGSNALVDRCSRVLDSARRPIPGAFGIGLAAGYPLAGRHGEASFKGQANGWALWQSDIGEEIVAQVLDEQPARRAQPLAAQGSAAT